MPPSEALIAAAHGGAAARLAELLDDGANPNTCDTEGTPVIVLATQANRPEAVRALLEARRQDSGA